ncbi:helix-turn-helix transcriptional regulator [Synechocystis sp. LKSZ1]|uniref:helix-turn-helix domain-containing protein n=1 Tax=Synechocystis sp. LKSZ1 TaxID=3144951 RepID=UPI00336BED3D
MYLPQESIKTPVTLKQVRKKLNITQDQLAERLGTKRPNISNIERGVEIPDWLMKALTLHSVLRQAGYSFDDLLLSLPDPEDHAKVKES